MKAQPVRLFDVFILAPFMIYAGLNANTPFLRNGLIIGGVGTAVYNWRNYQLMQQLLKGNE
jgi:hypothetical protein